MDLIDLEGYEVKMVGAMVKKRNIDFLSWGYLKRSHLDESKRV